jgi:hypothetical protein
MNDWKAYSILKIKPGTSLSDIEKKYELFVKLYKRHLMGEALEYTPQQLEEMKEAYESLLYKRITDEELEWLYPLESQSLSSRAWRYGTRLAGPFLKKHRAKVIYTVVMLVLTLIILGIVNYKPVDLRIMVLHDPTASMMEYQYRIQLVRAYQSELKEYLCLDKPIVEYYSLFVDTGMPVGGLTLYPPEDVDVLILKEQQFSKLLEMGFEPMPLWNSQEQTVHASVSKGIPAPKGIRVNPDTTLYRYLCNFKNDNKEWVAVIPSNASHKDRALAFLRYVGESP